MASPGISRRALLSSSIVLVGGCAGFGGPSRMEGDPLAVGEQVGFETYDTGVVPASFVLVGNEDQQVVASPAASGDRSYRMRGDPGECWRAMARFPAAADLAFGDAAVFEGAYRLGDGVEGCHEGSGAVTLTTDADAEEFGPDRETLLQFHPDGRATAIGTEVGRFDDGEWVSFVVEYARNRADGEVTYTCYVNDTDGESVSRPVRDYEDDLSAIELTSGDYTVYWDDVGVRKP